MAILTNEVFWTGITAFLTTLGFVIFHCIRAYRGNFYNRE